MKKTISVLILFLLSAVLSQRLLSFTVKSTAGGDFIHWPREKTAIFYAVGAEIPGPHSSSIAAVARAFENWEKQTGNIKFIYTGLKPESGAIKDGINTFSWVNNEWAPGEEIVAISTTWYDPQNGMIEEVDVEFNARDYDWIPGKSPDIQETALHEIGHLLGIDHSFNPNAAMYEEIGPHRPVVRTLSRDDTEALTFLYPPTRAAIDRYDLPVLFFPDDFPDQSGNLSSIPSPPPLARHLIALGAIDVKGAGFCSDLAAVYRNKAGETMIEIRDLDPPGAVYPPLISSPSQLGEAGSVSALAGIDFDRDGIRREVAILSRFQGRETVSFYRDLLSDDADLPPSAAISLGASAANNVVGMAAIAAAGSGNGDNLAILRAEGKDFYLYIHRVPFRGNEDSAPPSAIRIPGLHRGSHLLGLAVLDADGDGVGGDPVLVERTGGGEYWLHAFRLIELEGSDGYDLEYVNSAALPESTGGLLPNRIAAVDLNRDGYFNELIIFSLKK